MKVNGVKLKEAIRLWEMRREAAAKRFSNNFFARRNDGREHPLAAMEAFHKAEENIAVLEAAQARYNLDTTVSVASGDKTTTMTLCEAVKRIGGASRIEAMWRKEMAEDEDKYEHYRLSNTGEREVELPSRVFPLTSVVEQAAQAASYTSALRGAIAVGNSREVDFATLAPDMFA